MDEPVVERPRRAGRLLLLGLVALVIAGAGLLLAFGARYPGQGRHGAYIVFGGAGLAVAAAIWGLRPPARWPTILAGVGLGLLAFGLAFVGTGMCAMSFNHPCFPNFS